MDDKEQVQSKRGRKRFRAAGWKFGSLLPIESFRKGTNTYWKCGCTGRGSACVSRRENPDDRYYVVAWSTLSRRTHVTCGCMRYSTFDRAPDLRGKGECEPIEATTADYARANVMPPPGLDILNATPVGEPLSGEFTPEEIDFFEIDTPLPDTE